MKTHYVSEMEGGSRQFKRQIKALNLLRIERSKGKITLNENEGCLNGRCLLEQT